MYVGANDGNMYAIEKKSGKIAWAFKTGGEILSSPAEYAGSIVFGSADGKLYRVSSKGKQVWACNTGGEICAAPLVDGEFIYVGGRNARFFAVQANTGKIAWKNEDAAYNIESKASSDANHVYFGAWDGNLYCLDKKTGKTAWKSPGPTNQVVKDNLARYHAPADNGPVAVDDRVFIADRGSEAGSYTQKGDFETTISSDCTAIGLSENRVALYLRLVRGPVTKIDLAGHELWESKTRTGRVPVSPLEKAGVVYVCSNKGKLSALDAANGQEKWTYQVTPQLYVMAGIALDSNIAYTCGLDGVVTAIKFP